MNATKHEVGASDLSKLPAASGVRAYLATVVATVALLVTVAGVVYGPAFVTEASLVAQRTPIPATAPTLTAAVRQ